jgi:hypothetical protein
MNDPDKADPPPLSREDRMRLQFGYLVLIGVATAAAIILFTEFYYLMTPPYRDRTMDYILTQPRMVIGVPFAGAMAAVVVLLLRTTEGPVEFEALGFKFRGASGPIVMWVFCFLSGVGAIRLLWIP